ncbi:TniQ family protein [Kitasatospora sp. NPDC002965]|uniref:TniQ family protein n=1 Tax=Kitasatospora sp. NPDC002965 TaxID=3154775 RepID=UPI0033BA18BD
MSANEPAPLPRSLDPLPGESLPGFILRLAHLLDLAPSVLMRQAGLATPGVGNQSSQARHLLMMEPTVLESFARCTRLTEAEAEALSMRRFVGRYPAVTEALVSPGGTTLRPTGRPRDWLFLTSSRYCPQCLAGDGSEIQRRHGGAWKVEWHFGMVFACLQHNALLEDLCPSCVQPAHSRGNWSATRTLIPSQWVAGLHPAQCRTKIRRPDGHQPCGQRLDTAAVLPVRPLTPELASLQRKIIGLLAPSHDPAAASAAIRDLQVMSAVVCATWPKAAAHATFELPHALDAYLSSAGTGPSVRVRWDATPPNSTLTAALLALADTLLAQPRPTFQRSLGVLLQDVEPVMASNWTKTRGAVASGCTPLTRLDVEHALTLRFPKPSMRPGPDTKPIIPVRERGYLPEHIPQWLPDGWLSLLISDSARARLGSNDRFRRTAAVHLVQAATGSSLFSAAQFLGIPAYCLSGRGRTLTQITSPDGQVAPRRDLTEAFETLAQHIARLPDPPDYSRRRHQLAFWNLRLDEWYTIADQLPPLTSSTSKPKQDGLIRECASAYIWAKATGSEWALAPCFHPPFATRDRPVHPNLPEYRMLSRIHYTEKASEYFQALRQALDTYAHHLALSIPKSP